ncbi:hypothetical protein FCM35_KLT19147 [Carex littledalei]|uniref:Uncharacterized protein n=1 Tax=Carex littledalei TaxID=544730 RepID=A0A833RIN5_9POAL|nr:hypothetical protein FCM35_KLT19147 [Carex littledalei]
MSSSLVLQNNPSKPNISNSPFSARSNRVNIKWPVITIYCASRLLSMPMVVVRAEQVPTMAFPQDHEQVSPDDKRAKWFVWSFLSFLPFYKNFLVVEDRIVKTATTVLHVVESVAEVADKGAKDFERSLPENSNLKKVVQTAEMFFEEVYKDAEVAESFIEKV